MAHQLKTLPGVGERGAWRMAVYLAGSPPRKARELAKALIAVTEKMSLCPRCHNLAQGDLCWICQDPERDKSRICVVEDVLDLFFIEDTGAYQGLYHVIGGLISPWEGVTPETLKIDDLMGRLKNGVQEVILALPSTLEGEATSQYLARLLKGKVKVTRLGRGLPVGMEPEFTDSITLGEAMKGREEM
ncbi:MAG: recombination protein RecR [Aquificota bacterium]|nr:MAG: recombination protein RecR [Aquificota bacterium]